MELCGTLSSFNIKIQYTFTNQLKMKQLNFYSILGFSFSVLSIFLSSIDCIEVKEYENIEQPSHFMYIEKYCTQTKFSPRFKKLILFIIDALRSDFVPTLKNINETARLPFLEQTMQTNGLALQSIASIPTVTLPRIKTLISGTMPSFSDYINNLNAYQIQSDNIIQQFHRVGNRIVFYGDDMWGHLFPHESGVATRSNLTTSFFATDFNEVDTNVTFNMQNELKQIDQWDVMVLHYLGLDHIGHTRGYHSPLIPKKLLEYDGYFQELFNGLQRQSSEPCLIVVAGDHGMTNDGNHGGETYEETHTPLIFISTDDHHQYSYPLNNEPLDASRTFLQIDFAPTISSLFQINIPDQSQGRLISSVMERFSINQSEHLCSLFRNSIQIQHIFKQEKNSKQKKNFDEIIQLNQLFARALEYHYNYIQTESKSMNFFEESVETYQQYLNLIQQKYVFNIDSGQYVFGYCIVLLIILSFIFGVLFRFEYLNQNSILFCVKWFEPISNVLFGSIIGRAIALTIIVGNAFGLVSMNFIQREHLYWNFIQLIILIIIIIENYRQVIRCFTVAIFCYNLLYL